MYKEGLLNPLLHDNTFWRLWNIMFLKILWKKEHLLIWSKCSIFHNIFKSMRNYLNFSWIFQCCLKKKMMSLSKISQWSQGSNHMNNIIETMPTQELLWCSRTFYRKITDLFFNEIICCGYSKEPSQWDGSFEHPKHMLKIMGKKIFTILRWQFLFIYNCV